MRQILALIQKDYLLLIRDRAGLAMMFIMPLCLVILMAYLQDSTFNSITESKIKIILLNEDKDSLGNAISNQLHQTKIFNIEEDNFTINTLEEKVANGDFQLGIYIPKNTTDNIRKNIQHSVFQAFGSTDTNFIQSKSDIKIFIDPTTKNSFKATISSNIKEYAAKLQSTFILKEVVKEVNKISPMPINDIDINQEILTIKEQYAQLNSGRIVPNSVQHNVPAWGMFAVFFIVISLSGNMIKEREDGSYMRLMTMPCPYYLYLLSKVIVYLVICSLQFLMMFLMGIYILPQIGLPALEFGHSLFGLVFVCISSSLAAIGYGIAIGKISTSSQQAAIFGSISVVIMAAIGGIWIPTFVMPRIMQTISLISPLNWGLSGFYDIFVRDYGISCVLPKCALLLAFSLICIAIAIIHDKKRI